METGCSDFMMLCTSLLCNTTPIHCTPLPLHPPLMNTHTRPCGGSRAAAEAAAPRRASSGARKGTNGVSTHGDHCKFHVFRQRDLLGTPVYLSLSSQKRQGVAFSPICQNSFLSQRPHQCRPHLSATEAPAGDALPPGRQRASNIIIIIILTTTTTTNNNTINDDNDNNDTHNDKHNDDHNSSNSNINNINNNDNHTTTTTNNNNNDNSNYDHDNNISNYDHNHHDNDDTISDNNDKT